MKIRWRLCQLGMLGMVCAMPAKAQIIPDSSVGTVVTPNVTIKGVVSDRIDGGAVRGANLFHSFSEFNIQSGQGAYFSNPAGISNIFTRVTGSNLSNINGILGVLGNANLFLLNPNGIIFGANARLDLNSSFLATTANNINFADGTNFSASNPQAVPLLTVSVLVGLGLGSNPGAIQVQGIGHNLTASSLVSPYIGAGASPTGLRVQPGNTLALVGGDVVLTGGVLTAPQGRIELGSGAGGVVSLSPSSQGWTLGYDGVSSFRNIRLSQRALVDASGSGGGAIQVQGARVMLADGSIMLIQNQGFNPAGDIRVNASESLELIGTTTDESIASSLRSETVRSGNNGEIAISTKWLVLQNGANINNITYGIGSGGDIAVNASESIQLFGLSPAQFRSSSLIADAFGSGYGGNITLATGQLSIRDGGHVLAVTVGSGSAGNVTVNASKSVEAIGVASRSLQPSLLSSGTISTGNAGSLTVNTRRLSVRDGGRIDSSTLASGAAGSVTVNAQESVEVSGTVPGSRNPSLIVSSANIVDRALQQFYGLPSVPSGASGDVTINTPVLSVTNGGAVNVSNEGIGNAGTASVNARSIFLDNRGSITAATASGQGGNIILHSEQLQLRHDSDITATAGGTGNGGNINLNADTIVQLENSDITANAVRGRGGNIEIVTQGIFRAESKITASSQLGISGVVNLNVLNFNQQNALVEQSSNFVSVERVVAGSCLTRNNTGQGKFAVTGNGGLPESPDDALVLPYELAQVREVGERASGGRRELKAVTPSPIWKLGDRIQEAKGLSVTANGHMVLSATSNSQAIASPQTLTCHSNS